MEKKITPADIELRKSTERGGFTIWINGELWGMAAPKWCGGRGLMHHLRYPDAGAIQDKQDNGYRYAANVRGYKMRVVRNEDHSAPVPKQEDAIKIYMADLINRGLVESPKEIKERRDKQTVKNKQAQETRERHEIWMRDGLISLAKRPDITDKEAFAVKHAYKECFCTDMPEGEE